MRIKDVSKRTGKSEAVLRDYLRRGCPAFFNSVNMNFEIDIDKFGRWFRLNCNDFIRVLIVPDDCFGYVANIPNERDSIRRIMHGKYDIRLIDDCAFIVIPDVEASLYDYREFNGNRIRGSFIIAGYDSDGNLASLTYDDMKKWYTIFA